MDALDIPEFLRRPLDPVAKRAITRQRNRGRTIPWKGWSGKPALRLPKNMEPASWALLRQMEKEKAQREKQKQKERAEAKALATRQRGQSKEP